MLSQKSMKDIFITLLHLSLTHFSQSLSQPIEKITAQIMY